MLGRALLLLTILIAAVLIIAYFNDPYVFSKKTPGTFEYVRKAEDLLDEGKLQKAVSAYEKAFDSSPDNVAVRSDLAAVYLKYAKALIESRNNRRALIYLIKARDILPNARTMNDLAIFYSQQALESARKYRWDEAAGYYQKARTAAMGSKAALKALAISIHNDGVVELKKDHVSLAIMCFKESLAINENSRTLGLLGEIYHNKRDLEMAKLYWSRANELFPDDKSIADKLEKLSRETALTVTEEKRELAHFDLRYNKDLPFDMAEMRDMLEKAYSAVGNDLGYFPASKTIIVLYSKSDFMNIYKLPSVIRAFYDGNIRMPLPETRLGKSELLRYIYHEYTHAAVSAITNNNCPPWFSEGIAMFEEYKERDTEIREFFPKIVGKRCIGDPRFTISSIDAVFRTGYKNTDLRASYIIAYTALKFIVDRWGVEGLQGVLKRMSGGQHVVNAIDDQFLISEKEFEKRWAEYAEKNYASPPA
ncbi:MAG: tetratricopeptide repeat protein [Candidatus Omnitrophota bacterium]|jgi:tetratricopeptide (TPR) repeat protein